LLQEDNNHFKLKSKVQLLSRVSKLHSLKMAEKKVVIVGGGVAGAILAKNIQNQANVTLIDP